MMHDKNSGFVIAVLSNGKVLREVNGTVFLPFHSEYAVRVKNPTDRRVGVTIDIDGTEITNGRVIVDPGDSVDIKRMLVDGNMHDGPALKFVPVGDSRVQDPTNSENGTIRVRFYREKVVVHKGNLDYVHFGTHEPWGYSAGTDPAVLRNRLRSATKGAIHSRGITGQSASFLGDVQCSASSTVFGSAAQAGATVEGSNVTQQFKEVSIEFESFCCATLVLKMKGLPEPMYSKTKQKLYCTNCGSRIRATANFCGKCGAKNMHAGALFR